MISVIIPARNEEDCIVRCLNSLRRQDYADKYEIIVVDGHSSDRTADIAKEYADKVYRMHPHGPGAARNDGARRARYEILAFIDADCVAPKHWLSEIEKQFADKKLVGLGGVLRPHRGKLIDKIVFKINSDLWLRASARLGTYQLTGNNCAYRKKNFLKINGFNIKISFFEDTELSMRMKKVGKLKVDGNLWIETSTRRFRKMGYLRLFWINFKAFINVLLKRPVTTKYFEMR